MTTLSASDNVVWLAHLLVITVLVNIRDDHGALVRTAQHRRFVDSTADVHARVLELVREHWPEAGPEDIEWHDDPDALAGRGEAWWTTAAEVDGVLRVVGGKQPN